MELSPATGARSSQVQREVEEYRQGVEKLSDLLNALETRLCASLRPPQPNKSGECADRAALVPLAEAIYNINADMRSRLAHLSDIIDRIEI